MVKPVLKSIYFENRELYKELKHLAIDDDLSVSRFIEKILSDYVEKVRK
jgi:predicted DNA-binding ribbon-helix-helix protein